MKLKTSDQGVVKGTIEEHVFHHFDPFSLSFRPTVDPTLQFQGPIKVDDGLYFVRETTEYAMVGENVHMVPEVYKYIGHEAGTSNATFHREQDMIQIVKVSSIYRKNTPSSSDEGF